MLSVESIQQGCCLVANRTREPPSCVGPTHDLLPESRPKPPENIPSGTGQPHHTTGEAMRRSRPITTCRTSLDNSQSAAPRPGRSPTAPLPLPGAVPTVALSDRCADRSASNPVRVGAFCAARYGRPGTRHSVGFAGADPERSQRGYRSSNNAHACHLALEAGGPDEEVDGSTMSEEPRRTSPVTDRWRHTARLRHRRPHTRSGCTGRRRGWCVRRAVRSTRVGIASARRCRRTRRRGSRVVVRRER
jgi:hypothetical protein